MTEETPSFDTQDRQHVYEYVAENGPVAPAELLDEEVVQVTPRRTQQIVAILRRDGYLEERFGKLHVAFERDAGTDYTTEDVDFTVRQARQEDLSGLVGVIRQITEEGTYIVGESVRQELDTVTEYVNALVREDDRSRSMFFVAVVDGEVIGWVDLREPELAKLQGAAQLTTGLLDEYRGRGIGGRLLEHAHGWAERYGYRKVFSSLPATNEDAIRFLEQNGWRIEATRPDQYVIDGDPVDEVMMAYSTGG